MLSFCVALFIATITRGYETIDAWINVYTIPSTVAGIFNLKLTKELLSNNHLVNNRLSIFKKALPYFAVVGVASLFFLKNSYDLFLYQMGVACGFYLSICTLPLMLGFWRHGHYKYSGLANSSMYLVQIIIIYLLFLFKINIKLVAVLSIISGAFVFYFLAYFISSKTFPFRANALKTKQNKKTDLFDYVNPATLTTERMITDQYLLTTFLETGLVSKYFFITRLMYALFNLTSSVFIPTSIKIKHSSKKHLQYWAYISLVLIFFALIILIMPLSISSEYLVANIILFLGNLFVCGLLLINITNKNINSRFIHMLQVLVALDFIIRFFCFRFNQIPLYYRASSIFLLIELFCFLFFYKRIYAS